MRAWLLREARVPMAMGYEQERWIASYKRQR
jgi:hypothetical protein